MTIDEILSDLENKVFCMTATSIRNGVQQLNLEMEINDDQGGYQDRHTGGF